MFRISLLAFGFLVCFLAVSAEESQDQDLSNIVSDLASLRRDVRSPGVSTKKKSKKGEKKARRKKKKGPSSKRRTAKNNSKRPKKKSGSNQNRRKNNGKKNLQRKQKSKKPKSKRKIKKKPQKIKIAKKNDKRRTKPRKCNRQTGADDGTCSANIETAMDYEGKQIKNFNNQKKRIEDFDKLMKNKGGKKENFQNTTTYMKEALGSDNSCNGTTNETDAQTAVSTHTTLSNCSTSVDAGCSIPSSTYNTTELTSCEISFAAVTTKNAECYKLTTATSPDLSAACTCWAAAATLVETTKALKCSAVTPYQSMTALKKTCLSKFSECKKAEDASVGLIQVCNGRTTPSTASVPSPAPAPAPAAPSPAASPSTAAPVPTPSAAPVTTTAAAAPTPSTAAASPTTTTAAAAPTTTAAGSVQNTSKKISTSTKSTTATSTTTTITFSTTTTIKSCETGWSSYKSNCYKVETSGTADWTAARTACQGLSGDLASVLEQGVQDLLYSLRGSADFFIGGTDVGSSVTTAGDDSGFTWASGDAWGYKNWWPTQNQPNHASNQDCVKVRENNGFWDDIVCTKSLNYACTKSAL